MPFDPAKLAQLVGKGGGSQLGGKGTTRRSQKPSASKSGGQEDKKLQAALKKLNVQPIPGVGELNMFLEDGNVLHFSAPKVQGALGANTFAIYGQGVKKELTELVPGILNQLGPDSLASLRKLAESYQAIQQTQGRGAPKEEEDDDDEVPALVESFEVQDTPAKPDTAPEAAKIDDMD